MGGEGNDIKYTPLIDIKISVKCKKVGINTDVTQCNVCSRASLPQICIIQAKCVTFKNSHQHYINYDEYVCTVPSLMLDSVLTFSV